MFYPALQPLDTAVIVEARRAEAELISADVDALGKMRAAFHDIRPLNAEIDSSTD
ncbi:hypothetical protein [Mycobacterium lepromatosis]|uniref:hypothetical protein n=1 Tax=Mycobacterium lepromatosis TaxID=480418 RepID=UPI000A45DD51|nr:hypothetical protein [Mycobacterium lepromatosis]